MDLAKRVPALGCSFCIALSIGCTSTEADRPSKTRALVATPASPLPKGLVCGLSYTQSTDQVSVDFGGGIFVEVKYTNDFLGGGFTFGPSNSLYPTKVRNTTVHNAYTGSCNNVPTVYRCMGGATLYGGYGTVWHCQADAVPQEGYELHVAIDAGDAFSYWKE